MQREFKFDKLSTRRLTVKNFKNLIKFVHAYNEVKETGSNMSEAEIISGLVSKGYAKEVSVSMINYFKTHFQSIPTKEEETKFIEDYRDYMYVTHEGQREKVKKAQEDLQKRKYAGPGRDEPYSAEELKNAGRKASRKVRNSRLIKWAMIIGGALLGGFGLPILASAILPSLGIMSVSTISAITGVSGLVGLIGGGILGRNIHKNFSNEQAFENNQKIAKFFEEQKDSIEELEEALQAEEARLKEIENDFGLELNEATEYMESDEFNRIYAQYSNKSLHLAEDESEEDAELIVEEEAYEDEGSNQLENVEPEETDSSANDGSASEDEDGLAPLVEEEDLLVLEEEDNDALVLEGNSDNTEDESSDENGDQSNAAGESDKLGAEDAHIELDSEYEENALADGDENLGQEEENFESQNTGVGAEESSDTSDENDNKGKKTPTDVKEFFKGLPQADDIDLYAEEENDNNADSSTKAEPTMVIQTEAEKEFYNTIIDQTTKGISKIINNCTCSSVGRYMLLHLRNSAPEKIKNAKNPLQVSKEIEQEAKAIESDYRKYVKSTTKNNVAGAEASYMREISPDDKVEKGRFADETELPADFVRETENEDEEFYAALALSYVKQLKSSISKHLKRQGSTTAESKKITEKLTKEIETAISQNGGEFKALDETMEKIMGEITAKVSKPSISTLDNIEEQIEQ